MGTLAAVAALVALRLGLERPDLDALEFKIKQVKIFGTQFKPFLFPAQVARVC
jgi:hypothetical protein